MAILLIFKNHLLTNSQYELVSEKLSIVDAKIKLPWHSKIRTSDNSFYPRDIIPNFTQNPTPISEILNLSSHKSVPFT